MKKFSWKILNWALWTEILLSYFLPFWVTDNFRYQVGFPMPFLSAYDTGVCKSPFLSMHLNPLGLLLDIAVIYLAILACVKAFQKRKHGEREPFPPRSR
ncbi:hypothetical protein D3Z51_01920 [Clostridiaceae bacterium]|nr:hypothetical protein [Clostridiaceae bacterium]RKI18284.1 hypothetical protein D7V81_00050 [bacterium 1XD21-70]